MRNLYINVLKQIFAGLFLICFCIPVNSQNLIDLNAASSKNLQAQKSNNHVVKERFKDAERYRRLDYNKQLVSLNSDNIGDTLLLNFFDDKQYKSVILNVKQNYFGRTSITSKIVDTKFGYCYMVVSNKSISFSVEIPQKDECFFASVKDGQAYLSQVKKSKLDATALNHADVVLPEQNQQHKNGDNGKNDKGIDDPVIIDLLIVYTAAAKQWALNDYRVTDILDLIDQALQRSNIVMANSCTGITFNIVYVYLTNYEENNTIEDLYRITYPGDGYMDEVHDLRDEYYADEIVFIPKVDFTGGVAWLLNDENGFENDYLAVALSRVQQSSWTYTAVHELGHNMGCGHHAEQTTQPGPGLFYYSSGWRGYVNNKPVCTVMTYESSSYFSDGVTHTNIPYFSSPDIVIDGVTIGDPVTANNALTLKRTKTAVSNYRTPPVPTLTISTPSINFSNVLVNTDSSKTIFVTGGNLNEEILYAKEGTDAAFFNISQVSWNPLLGGSFRITFSPTEVREYHATITFSSSGATDKVLTLSGNAIFRTYAINATSNQYGTIDPKGIITIIEDGSQKFTFRPNDGYFIADVLIDGESNQNAITDGFYVFTDVVKNHTIHAKFSTTYTINATASENGTIEPEGITTVFLGESKKITFTPNDGYKIADVLVDGVSNENAIADGFYLFKNISKNRTIHAQFALLDINENKFDNVKIYSHFNNVYIQNVEMLRATAPQTVEILDMMGHLVYQGVISDTETVIPLRVSNGIYCVRIISQEKNIVTEKVLINLK